MRTGDTRLAGLLDEGRVLTHPFITGEIALGSLKQRRLVLDALADLPQARIADDGEVLHFIESNGLAGTGIGYIDAHLLAAVRLEAGSTILTRDKRLARVALRLGLAA
ncbi:MAG: VapC toxin family PIN domain ribonuclease [Alphaproteobacteria bacterium]|nr:MAG: VapC toxin family PIN domain ribonuclease [Alphaproteobacteria bacterium]